MGCFRVSLFLSILSFVFSSFLILPRSPAFAGPEGEASGSSASPPTCASPSSPKDCSRQNDDFVVKQGDVFLLAVDAPEGTTAVRGSFHGKSVPFFKTGDRRFESLIGVDLAEPASRIRIDVAFLKGSESLEHRSYSVEVKSANFATQKLTLPKGMVDLDSKTLKRVKREQKVIRGAFEHSVDGRLWSGNFIMPVEGKIAGMFGVRRIMNGEPRNPHSGEDIVVPLGTEVHATNRGVVRLIGNYFFNGNSVVLDHGMGLLTMYFHLKKVLVKEGETVERGQVIGLVGATGRATGPHLHWGVRLLDARVNPISLVQQPLDDTEGEAP
jgi:murein DD-endopeptidase MepM/ murein hydrolase activator NlpD